MIVHDALMLITCIYADDDKTTCFGTGNEIVMRLVINVRDLEIAANA